MVSGAEAKKGKSPPKDTSPPSTFDVSPLVEWAQGKDGKKGLRSRGKSQSGAPTGKVQHKPASIARRLHAAGEEDFVMMRVFTITVVGALAVAFLSQGTPSAEAAEKTKAGKKGKHYGDADSVGFFQMRVGSTAGKPMLKGKSRHKSVDDGGQNNFIHQLPSRSKAQKNPDTLGRVKNAVP